MPNVTSPGDKKWERENDCRTLVEAQEIRADKTRYKAAMRALDDKQTATTNALVLEKKAAKHLKAAFSDGASTHTNHKGDY